jgi:uncharacterized protein (TIGR02001 family)
MRAQGLTIEIMSTFRGLCPRSIAAAAATALLGLARPALAQDVSFNLGAQTDYAVRGISQTEGQASVFGGADVTQGPIYAGVWASNVSFPGDPDTAAEIDLYGGWRQTHGAWTLEAGAVGYLYVGQPDGADYNFVEAKLAASRTQGPLTVGAAVFASPDFFGASEDEAVYVEASTAVRLTRRLAVSGALGRQAVSSNFDYTSWNAGMTFSVTDKIALDLRGYDNDQHGFGDIYEPRLVVALKATF